MGDPIYFKGGKGEGWRAVERGATMKSQESG